MALRPPLSREGGNVPAQAVGDRAITTPTKLSADDSRVASRPLMGNGNHLKEKDAATRRDFRTATLAGPVRPMRRDADDRPRRDDRQRRPPDDPGGSWFLAERSRVGGQRVPDRVRRPAPALGSDR